MPKRIFRLLKKSINCPTPLAIIGENFESEYRLLNLIELSSQKPDWN